MADLWRDFWIRETRTGQQVAQLHDRYDDDDDDEKIQKLLYNMCRIHGSYKILCVISSAHEITIYEQ